MRLITRKTVAALALAGTVIGTAACGDFEILNVDNPSLNALEDDPTPSIIYAATQGLLADFRSATTSNLSTFAHYGREGYYIDVAQTSLTAFDVPLTPGGGGGWSGTYQAVRLVNTILAGLDKVGSEIADPDKEAVRGFAKTLEAYVLHGSCAPRTPSASRLIPIGSVTPSWRPSSARPKRSPTSWASTTRPTRTWRRPGRHSRSS
jgi:hypothetical protein